ncbi:hypothetical protein SVIO_057510 [Streptomyces violaceusniger]|uniref:Uncharacterized protein n=1 Tax=Streptomyces violaceusniger TaxID=68280 RepID=A0A4D4L9C5_STRVO|nr:hypothetical protein SVIO_057510 [Streptomyces violaceusniger]
MRCRQPKPIDPFGPTVLPGIAGDPSGDLCQFADDLEEGPADCLRMAAFPEKLHGRAEFAEGGAQQVPPAITSSASRSPWTRC